MVLYAMHDALVKPMPGAPQDKSLAETWSVSKDGLVYEFGLRKGVKFHNGEVMTAEDVKFSFERYRGASAKLLKDRVAAVEVVDPHKVRFQLKKPWLDFMTFFATPPHRRGLDRAQEVRGEGGRRGLQEGAGGRRPPTSSSRSSRVSSWYGDKKLRGILHTGSGASGNAATRIDSYAVTGGTYVYNTYPEIDGLFSEQVNEQNLRVRAQILHKIQQIIHDRAMFAPVMEPAFLNGGGSRVAVSGLGAIANFPYSAPSIAGVSSPSGSGHHSGVTPVVPSITPRDPDCPPIGRPAWGGSARSG